MSQAMIYHGGSCNNSSFGIQSSPSAINEVYFHPWQFGSTDLYESRDGYGTTDLNSATWHSYAFPAGSGGADWFGVWWVPPAGHTVSTYNVICYSMLGATGKTHRYGIRIRRVKNGFQPFGWDLTFTYTNTVLCYILTAPYTFPAKSVSIGIDGGNPSVLATDLHLIEVLRDPAETVANGYGTNRFLGLKMTW